MVGRVWRYRLASYMFLSTLFVYMLQPVMGGEIVAWGDNKFGQVVPVAGSAAEAAFHENDFVTAGFFERMSLTF